MTELDAEIGPLALELINEFGKAIQYGRVTPQNYNTATGKVTSYADPLDIRATVEEYSGQSFLSGLIEGGDKKVTIAAQALELPPTVQDTVTIDDTEYRIVGIKTVYSGDLPAIYELQCRK